MILLRLFSGTLSHPSAKVVQVLLKHGADATHCDKDGTSVLNAATAAGSRCNDELVLALLAVNGLLGLKFQGVECGNPKKPLILKISPIWKVNPLKNKGRTFKKRTAQTAGHRDMGNGRN